VGVALFADPQPLLNAWPWQITPVTARAFASWYVFMGLTLLVVAAGCRQPRETLLPYLTVATWSSLLLLLPLLNLESLRPAAAGFWPWLGLQAAVLVGCGAVTLRSLASLRAAHQTL